MRFKFPFTQEMGAAPLLNDVYKRLLANVTQKLRTPRSGQVPDGSSGGVLHFSETNLAPKIVQKAEGNQSIAQLYCFLEQSDVH